MSAIRNDEDLAVQRELLGLMEGIVENWKKKLLPHHPENFALYAESAIEQAEKLRAEIDEYLARKASISPSSAPAEHSPAKAS